MKDIEVSEEKKEELIGNILRKGDFDYYDNNQSKGIFTKCKHKEAWLDVQNAETFYILLYYHFLN